MPEPSHSNWDEIVLEGISLGISYRDMASCIGVSYDDFMEMIGKVKGLADKVMQARRKRCDESIRVFRTMLRNSFPVNLDDDDE